MALYEYDGTEIMTEPIKNRAAGTFAGIQSHRRKIDCKRPQTQTQEI
jgi:hypothetical protein